MIEKFPQSYMEMVKTCFTVKPSKVEEPKYYLGAYVENLYYGYGLYALTMWYKIHMEKSIKNLKKIIEEDGFIFDKNLSEVNYSPKKPF